MFHDSLKCGNAIKQNHQISWVKAAKQSEYISPTWVQCQSNQRNFLWTRVQLPAKCAQQNDLPLAGWTFAYRFTQTPGRKYLFDVCTKRQQTFPYINATSIREYKDTVERAKRNSAAAPKVNNRKLKTTLQQTLHLVVHYKFWKPITNLLLKNLLRYIYFVVGLIYSIST